MIDLNDAEILRIEQGPFAWMRKRQASSMDLEGFRKAAIEQFAMVGFRVDVKAYTTTQEGVFSFDVEITGRTDYAKPFDPDQMAWEVQKNILELPGKHEGVIKTDKGAVKALLSGDRPDPGKHHH